ncbi:hypothetical protein M436DRAFT_84846 [Aureobasidium namibiae CBS 147.97]|uniref:Uncharacterized protein n=1 Tax=Aureobasidium namibiae CBS 147.97 TaxID=1043004 RepID=A0A074WFB9_9PEZI
MPSSSAHRPDPAKFSYISKWIAKLSHDDLQQLLADAAVRHKDVFAALETKSEEAELTQRKDKFRIEMRLMNSYDSDRLLEDTTRSTSIRAPATEQAVVLDNGDEEEEDEDIKFGDYAIEVNRILEDKWAHLSSPEQFNKVNAATDDIMAIVDGIISSVGHNNDYTPKAASLLNLFVVAEALTESSTMLADHVRNEIMNRGFYEKVLGTVHSLDLLQTIRFLQDEVCSGYSGRDFRRFFHLAIELPDHFQDEIHYTRP